MNDEMNVRFLRDLVISKGSELDEKKRVLNSKKKYFDEKDAYLSNKRLSLEEKRKLLIEIRVATEEAWGIFKGEISCLGENQNSPWDDIQSLTILIGQRYEAMLLDIEENLQSLDEIMKLEDKKYRLEYKIREKEESIDNTCKIIRETLEH